MRRHIDLFWLCGLTTLSHSFSSSRFMPGEAARAACPACTILGCCSSTTASQQCQPCAVRLSAQILQQDPACAVLQHVLFAFDGLSATCVLCVCRACHCSRCIGEWTDRGLVDSRTCAWCLQPAPELLPSGGSEQHGRPCRLCLSSISMCSFCSMSASFPRGCNMLQIARTCPLSAFIQLQSRRV